MKWYKKLESIFLIILGGISCLSLCFLMLLTVLDVVGRYFFNSPINGATELTEHSLAILIFSAMPFVSWQHKQVVVDLFDNLFSATYIKIQEIVVGLVSVIGYLIIAFRILELAQRSDRRNQVSEYLEIPVSFIQNFVGVLCIITALGIVIFFLAPRLIRLPPSK